MPLVLIADALRASPPGVPPSEPGLRHGSMTRTWGFRRRTGDDAFSQRSPDLRRIVGRLPRQLATLRRSSGGSASIARSRHDTPSRRRAGATSRSSGSRRLRVRVRRYDRPGLRLRTAPDSIGGGRAACDRARAHARVRAISTRYDGSVPLSAWVLSIVKQELRSEGRASRSSARPHASAPPPGSGG